MSLFARLLIVLGLVLLLEVYVSIRVAHAIKKIPFKPDIFLWLFRVILIYINIFPLLYLINWGAGAIFNSQNIIPLKSDFIEYFLYLPFLAGLLIIAQSFIYIAAADILALLIKLVRLWRADFSLYLGRTIALIFFIFTVYVPARMYYDYASVDVRHTSLKVKNLHESLGGLRITFISDMQADRYTQGKRLSDYIEKVNETNPDLILIAGDFITNTPNYIPEIGRQLVNLKAKHGIYACVGDHDQWAYRGDPVRSLNEVRAAVEGAGIPLLDNQSVVINQLGPPIILTAATNTYSRGITMKEAGALMNGDAGAGLKIFLVHQPEEEMMRLAASKGYNLFLAGHTHGGQITLAFPFIQLTPTLLETSTYIKGDFHFGDMLAVITRGLGMSILPIRYNSQPEITVIDVEKK